MISREVKPLLALTGLRFFAAFAVLLHHCRGKFGIDGLDLPLGNSGVSFFFVLSGFILAYVYTGRLNSFADVKRFWFTRWARIWPLHATCLILLVAVFHGFDSLFESAQTVAKLASNVLLLQSWVPITSWVFSFNGVSWSISTEMFFYLVFPAFFLGSAIAFRRKYIGLAIALIGILFLIQFAQNGNWLGTIVEYTRIAHVNPLIRLFEFVTGIAIGRLFSSVELKKRAWYFDFAAEILVLVGGLALVIKIQSGSVYSALTEASWLGPVWSMWYHAGGSVFLFGAIIWVFGRSQGPLSRVLSTPTLVYLGEISFSLYMIHPFIIRCLTRFYRSGEMASPFISFLVIASLSLCASCLLYRFIEIPAKNFLLKVYDHELQVGWQQLWRKTRESLFSVQTARIAGICCLTCLVLVHSIPAPTSIPPDFLEVVAHSQLTTGCVSFDNVAKLHGLQCVATERGLALRTVWESGQPTNKLRFIHICDDKGKVLRNAVQKQSSRSLRPTGEVWLDEVLIPYEHVTNAKFIGLGFHSLETGLAKIDCGPRSMNGSRLNVQLPSPSEQLAAQNANKESLTH